MDKVQIWSEQLEEVEEPFRASDRLESTSRCKDLLEKEVLCLQFLLHRDSGRLLQLEPKDAD